MKAKSIKAMIHNKLDKWFKSIEDESLRARLEENTIVSGGCIASMLLNEDINDYDLYFRNKKVAIDIANYYIKKYVETVKPNIVPQVRDNNDQLSIMIKSSGIATDAGDSGYEYFEMRPENEAAQYVENIFNPEGEGEQTLETVIEDKVENKILPKPKKGKSPVAYMSANAISLYSKIQIIIRFYGEPRDIHKNFDFTHCTGYYTSWNRNLVLPKKCLNHC